jgi:hypothetical protein
MRFFDTVSGYMFIISAGNNLESRKLDIKLENIYKNFVDFVIKAPFFNVIYLSFRVLKKLIILHSSKNVMISYTLLESYY